jgi:SAM-dependent methyltransferase
MSNPEIRAFVKMASETLPFPGPIYEFGSKIWPGQERVSDHRPFFPGREFVGCDMLPGIGVDRVVDVQDTLLRTATAGSVICTSTLEHLPCPWDAVREMKRVLKPGGTLLIAVPMNFPIHDYPSDYWRFTPECLRVMLTDNYDWPFLSIVTGQGTKGFPENVIAVAASVMDHSVFDHGAEAWKKQWDKWCHIRKAYRKLHHMAWRVKQRISKRKETVWLVVKR